MSPKMTFNEISEAIEYFPETGMFIWKIPRGNFIVPGSIAGNINGKGYWNIQYRNRIYFAHRIAWLLMTGVWPDRPIDHRNLNKSDNRWSNLRLATKSQNGANRKGHHKFPKGVYPHWKKFRVQIKKDGKLYYLGLYTTVEEAASAYAIAAKQYFGEFART